MKRRTDAQSASQPSKSDSMHVIQVENVPWTTTKKEIVDLFDDINILNGKSGIHFMVDNLNHRNDAFVQLAAKEDYQLALDRKKLRKHHFKIRSS